MWNFTYYTLTKLLDVKLVNAFKWVCKSHQHQQLQHQKTRTRLLDASARRKVGYYNFYCPPICLTLTMQTREREMKRASAALRWSSLWATSHCLLTSHGMANILIDDMNIAGQILLWTKLFSLPENCWDFVDVFFFLIFLWKVQRFVWNIIKVTLRHKNWLKFAKTSKTTTNLGRCRLQDLEVYGETFYVMGELWNYGCTFK